MTNSISFVGTSDGLPSVNRGQASFLVRLAGKQILLDAGEPCSRSLLEMGENPNDIDAVIISHTHSDHVGGLPMLLQTMWLNARDRGLPIWMPRRGIKPLREWLKTCYLFDEALPFKADWRALSLRREERIGRVRMRAFATTHLASTKAMIEKKKPGAHGVGFDSFAVVLTGGSKRIAYSGDVGDPSEVAPLCVKPVDVLIVELAHFPVVTTCSSAVNGAGGGSGSVSASRARPVSPAATMMARVWNASGVSPSARDRRIPAQTSSG